jgi:signal transduction histidine kinase
MRRALHIWLIYFACLGLAAGAVAWLSVRAIDSERAEATARRQAMLEENTRLALWRIDSALVSFLAQENARPFEAYRYYLPAMESHGLTQPSPRVKLYFRVDPNGAIKSPQRDAEDIAARLAELRLLTNREELLTALRHLPDSPEKSPELVDNSADAGRNSPADAAQQTQQERASAEFVRRSQLIQQNASSNAAGGFAVDIELAKNPARVLNPPPVVGSLEPIVRNGELLLARKTELLGRTFIQGAWLDWPLIRNELQAEVGDLLPAARLEFLKPGSMNADRSRLLASLPVRLDPGPLPADPVATISPVRWSLIVAWGGLLVAAAAVAILLRGVVALSERRADFVSAVTHELRTPLTTFRMYAGMLSEGMVTDEAKRRNYLQTLRSEAERLNHLVQNVLAYARLERGGLGNRIQEISVDALLSAATERLSERASQVGLDFSVDANEAIRRRLVRADPSAVEQVLFNLVDNACKYAAAMPGARPHDASTDVRDSANAVVQLRATIDKAHLRLCLRDHGPGISAEQRRKLFQPFRKSADEAARSAPGVGLGLALSRRLARELGGELWLDESYRDGAAFVLELRLGAPESEIR